MRSQWLYIVLMLLAAASLGLTATIVDYLYLVGFSIRDLTNVQYGFAMIALWMIVLPVLRKQRFPRGKDWWILIGTGVTGAAAIYFYFQSLTMMPVSLSIILLFQFSWMTTIIDSLVKRTMPPASKWGGMGVILIGTFLAVGFIDIKMTSFPLQAIIYGLLAAFCFALSLYFPEYISSRSTTLVRAALTVTISALFLIPLYPPTYLISGVLWENHFVWWGLLLALLGQIIPLLFMMISIPRIGGRMAGVLGSFELPTTVLSAYLIVNEQITWLRWMGVVLILIGILFSEYNGKSKQNSVIQR